MSRASADRPPRLVLRFVAVTALCLGAAAAAILLTTRHIHTVQAERAAAGHARILAEAVLGASLRKPDVAAAMPGQRRTTIDRMLRDRLGSEGSILTVSVVAPTGLVTYSTDHALIGTEVDPQDRRGGPELTSRVARVTTGGGAVEVLRSTVPLDVGGLRASVVIDQDYGVVAAAAREAFLPVAGILELVLVVLLALLVPVLTRVTRRMGRQLEHIRYQATHDDLTGLPNRVLFRRRLGEALEHGPTAVLVLDLNDFRDVNDTLGHAVGDELLRRIGSRLRAETGESGVVARLGGNSFGIVLPAAAAQDALDLAARLRTTLATPVVVGDVPLAFEAGVGIAVGPVDGDDVGTLVQRAEIAMHVAKARRTGVVAYDRTLDADDQSRLVMLADLRRALDTDEIGVHYQPKSDLRTGALRGVEALVRWDHPERGLLAPGAFLPFAEQTELIRPLTRRMLELAVAQAAAWQREGLRIQVAVNVTTVDLVDASFPDEVAALLERHGLRPGALSLELTESSMMSEPDRVASVLERLGAHGIELAIDDFGTGYSSLSYLRELPVHVLKIDRAFVKDLESGGSEAIVRATIELAHALGLQVVAEGVETLGVRDRLQALGCDVAQGYLIGRPLPAAELQLPVGPHAVAA